MKKKIMCAVLSLVMAVSFAACGGGKDTESGTKEPGTPDVSDISDSNGNGGSGEDKEDTEKEDDFRIGIVTGSFAQNAR